jgi:hypothetical protein
MEFLGVVLGIGGATIGLWIVWWVFVAIPYEMATERGRDGLAWVLVSLFGSPFLAIVLLWYVGELQEEGHPPH